MCGLDGESSVEPHSYLVLLPVAHRGPQRRHGDLCLSPLSFQELTDADITNPHRGHSGEI